MQSTGTTPKLFSCIRIVLYNKDATRALASFLVADALMVTGLRIIEGKNGLFVSMPSKKEPGGEYRDIVFPCSREMREKLQAEVLAAYRVELTRHAEEAGVAP